MSYLRLMTFNVQLLPSVPGSASPGEEAEDRAYAIGTGLKALTPEERPDVLVCNEVFSEDGRDELIRHLRPLYPTILSKLDDCNLGQDSGLLLASRLPLKILRSGQDHYFYSFTDSADSDALACKGVCIVRFDAGFGEITLAFTHTQASYKYEDEYQRVRESQFIQIFDQIDLVAGRTWPNGVLLVGDLNVRGDAGAVGNEWTELFETPNGRIGRKLDDGWRTFMHPPGLPERDPGFTNNNLEEGINGLMPIGTLMRLDYFCFVRNADRKVVAQQLRTRFRSYSDHWSLEADINLVTPHCTPADAHVLGGATTTGFDSGLAVVEVDIAIDGAYQWIYVADSGTYSILFDEALDIEVAVYSEVDLSDPWRAYAVTTPNALGIDEIVEVSKRWNLGGTVVQYDLPTGFLVRVRPVQRASGFTGAARIGIYRHQGATPATAIKLRSYDVPKDPILPVGSPLGTLDECWFRSDLDAAFTKEPVHSTFVLENATANSAEFVLCDVNLTPVQPVTGSGSLEVRYSTVGPETVFLKLKRQFLTDTAFRVSWRCALTYLRSVANVRPMALRCKDETGTDFLGEDEIKLILYADGISSTHQFYEDLWGSADSNELFKLEAKVQEVAFVDYIRVEIYESDFIGEGPDSKNVAALSDSDPIMKASVTDIPVQSGKYSFECTLARHRQI